MLDPMLLHRRRWPFLVLGGLLLVSALSGATLGYFLRLDLPDVRALEDYNPPVMSRVLASDGRVVATFAEQRRILIDYPDIPETFRQALIATEDSSFLNHTGIDFKGILRAAWRDLLQMELAQGASTLTQQLARNLFLHPEKTIRRKLQEALLALEIERQYTKQEILRFYCNQIYMGHGRWGLEAAARHYFAKPARQLTLPESAMLAGLIQRPEAISPFKNPERALERRNHVLRRMELMGWLSAKLAEETRQSPIGESTPQPVENPAPYFVEEVRRWLQDEYGSSSLYKEGFEARTTLDPRLQAIANRAVEAGVRTLDRRQGWRDAVERIPTGEDPTVWESPEWLAGIEIGAVHDGVVVSATDSQARVRVGAHIGFLGKDEVAWTGKKKPSDLFRVGDLIQVRVVSIDEESGARLELEQRPLVEAALVALEPSTGAIRALVGGFDFERSEFDRAMQARRQTGSAFKPLVYAAALDHNRSLADTILDEPTVFIDRRNPQPYQPENYSNKYYETVTLRTALERSANIATVKLLDHLGYAKVIDTARRLGIGSDLQPFPSLALGSFEVTLLELTSAYATFANQGVHVQAHLVEEVRNQGGAVLHHIEPEVHDAVSPQIAFLMNSVLSGVITDGTGRAAARLNLALAGKTGTTDNNTDAWFIGYAPSLAVGVWLGFDEPRSLGSRETGAQAALPIWQTFMEQAFEGRPTEEFAMPSGLTIVSIDRKTGLKANLGAHCEDVVSEVFIHGTEPTAYCTENHHRHLKLPYPFQRYPLNDQGALMIPQDELARLLDAELDVFLVDGGTRLEAYGADGVVTLPLAVGPPSKAPPIPAWLVEQFDPSEWTGLDGRKAQIVWLR